MVQGCVVRLRKVLGVGSDRDVAGGLPVDDAGRRGRCASVRAAGGTRPELLTLGEHERAAYVSGEALALWRGPALRELEGWDAGRIEAGRLDELRLDAEEIRLDAAPAGGPAPGGAGRGAGAGGRGAAA